ncbi:hypothetical protein COT20_01650 [bacterium (Candidatus Gribaldobacteria) CG08_land_8_20_14_0_20_39_15]|uniref:Flippase-like domain-containing protein n=1 Tax=bacterium (Candidatus Gribaldobacteria) CG08_land_8_20_14_0_20_39_15 TaxID=2014273 RepID=A0A2M6XUD7_9BACT|nr:MAG: hypothetical protein COT20_01650 [bacterium (Candidatus Gribaldobacteria) CG08_land_8_20_14_0_20_39_15]
MGRLLKSILAVLSGIIIFAVVTVKAGSENLGRAFSLLFDFQGLLLLALTLIAVYFGVCRLKIIFKSFGDNLSTKDLFALWLAGFGIGYLAPFSIVSGDAAKVYFTKKHFNFLTWQRTISTGLIERITDGTIFFVFLFAGLAVFAFKAKTSLYLSAGVLIIISASLGLLLFFYFKRWRRESVIIWFFKKLGLNQSKFFNGQSTDILLRAEKEVFGFCSCSKKYFWQAIGLSIARHLMLFCRAVLLLFFLTGRLGFFEPLAVFGFANLGSISSVPASLGTLDLSVGLAFSGLGLSFRPGTVFSMVWRAVDLLVGLIGIGFSVKFGFNLLERKLLRLFSPRRQ